MRSSSRAVGCLLLQLAGSTWAAECLQVEGPVIRVSTLTPFIVLQPSIQLDRILASTPNPGAKRWITAAQIAQWSLSPREGMAQIGVCLERELHPLRAESLIGDLQSVLNNHGHDDVQILEITSIQPLLVPDGRLRLALTDFQPLATGVGLCGFMWRSTLEFDSHRLMTVRILGHYEAEATRLVAKRSLQAGDVLSAEDYSRITEFGCSRGTSQSALPEHSILKRAVGSGYRIEPAMLKTQPVVEAGTVVRIEASAGTALVSLVATAESSGARGDAIFVRNDTSGKRIRVVITGKGEAIAIVAGATK